MALKHYLSPRVLSLLFLGFASGLPLPLCGSTLQAWYTEAGASLMVLGLLTLVGQPYVYKIFWSPLLDRYQVPLLGTLLGRRRSWMLVFQILCAITLVLMSLQNPATSPGMLIMLAVLLAIFSASQDIAIGAYQTDIPKAHERGLVAANYILGWRIAYITAGAMALVIAQYINWHLAYLSMAGLMVIGMLTSLFAPMPDSDFEPPATTPVLQSFIAPIQDFIMRHSLKGTLLLLLLMILYKLGEALALSLTTPFLLKYLHFQLVDVAFANKVVGVAASIMGALAGGFLMLRMRLFTTLLIFGIVQALTTLPFMWLAIVGHHYPVMLFAVFSENFGSGLSSTAFVAFMMKLCNTRYSATQFALLTAFPAVGRVFIGPLAALMVGHIGWSWFYLSTVIVAIPGIALLFVIKSKLNETQAAS